MPFGKAPTVFVGHQRAVIKPRRLQLQRAIKQQLPESGSQQVGAAHHLGDSHGSVIDNNSQLVGRDVVFAPDHKVTEIHTRCGNLFARTSIDELQHLAFRHPETPSHTSRRRRPSNILLYRTTKPGIDRFIIALVRRTQCTGHIFARAFAAINQTSGPESFPCPEVKRPARTLDIGRVGTAAIGPLLPI